MHQWTVIWIPQASDGRFKQTEVRGDDVMNAITNFILNMAESGQTFGGFERIQAIVRVRTSPVIKLDYGKGATWRT